MPTIGYRGTCPKCGCVVMECEDRYGQIRAECPDCGYFYEIGYLDWVASEISGDGRRYSDETEVDEEAKRRIRDMGFSLMGGRVFRIGFIEKTPENTGELHITNTWFSIPTGVVSRPTRIRWVEFTDEELKRFDWTQWEAKDTRH